MVQVRSVASPLHRTPPIAAPLNQALCDSGRICNSSLIFKGFKLTLSFSLELSFAIQMLALSRCDDISMYVENNHLFGEVVRL